MKKSAPRRTVAIRLLDGQTPELLKELLQTPHVANARIVAGEIHFELSADESAACDILGELIAKKFKIIEFRQTKANLRRAVNLRKHSTVNIQHRTLNFPCALTGVALDVGRWMLNVECFPNPHIP